MSVISFAALKAKFASGEIPTGADFVDLVDTLSELIAQNSGSETVGKYLISDGSGFAEFEELARYPLIADYFVGADADPITGRYGDVGVLWNNTAAVDHAQILNNSFLLDPADFGAKETAIGVFAFDVTQSDFVLVIPITLGNDGVNSVLDLFLRSNDLSSYPVRVTLTVNGSTGSGYANAYISAILNNEVNFSFTYDASSRNFLVIVLKGNSFRVYVDNVLKAELIDNMSSQTIGRLSVQHGSPSTGTHPIYIDYFLVERI